MGYVEAQKLLEIKVPIIWFSEFEMISDNLGMQYIRIEKESENLKRNDEQFADSGLYLFDFAQEKYQRVASKGRFIFSKGEYLYFVVEDKRDLNQYRFLRYDYVSKDKKYSDTFYLEDGRTLESFIKKLLYIGTKYIVFLLLSRNSWECKVLNLELEKITKFPFENSEVLFVTDENIFFYEEIDTEMILSSFDFEKNIIIKKSLDELNLQYCVECKIDNRLMLYENEWNGACWEGKIKLVDKKLNTVFEKKRKLSNERYLLGYAEDKKQLLWWSRGQSKCSGISGQCILTELETWGDIWTSDIGKEGFDALLAMKVVFWENKIIFSSFRHNDRSNGILILDRNTGKVDSFKDMPGNVRKIIPRKDSIYIHCVAGETEEKHYYYKLTE